MQLQPEKLRIVREECGVEIGFDRCQIDAVVFKAGVIAHDQKA